LARRGIWDSGLLGRRLAQPKPFIGEEEEGFVSADRAAKHTAKVILPLRRFGQTVEVRKPVLGVQHVIPEVFEQRAMESIGSGARHNRDLSTGRASELRSKRRRLDAKLLH